MSSRLFADFVGAWVVVSLVQLAVAFGRLLVARWRARGSGVR
jgi:hypothetical protein